MLCLVELQRAFVASMLDERETGISDAIAWDDVPPVERMRIYRNTFVASLTRVLHTVFPAVDRLVGSAFFDAAAEEFIKLAPPTTGDLNEYGSGFPDFLGDFEPAAELPYLPDIARLEWALNIAATAPDSPALDSCALASLQDDFHGDLRFAPHPAVSLLELNYPADHIADAVMSGDEAAMAEVDLTAGPVLLIISRGLSGPEVRRAQADEFEFLSQLYAGRPLAAVLECPVPEAAALLGAELVSGRIVSWRVDATTSAGSAA